MQLSGVTALALVASEPWWLTVQPNWRSKSRAVAVANQISRRRVECEHRKVREVQPAAARHAAKHKSDEQRLKQKLVICVAQLLDKVPGLGRIGVRDFVEVHSRFLTCQMSLDPTKSIPVIVALVDDRLD